jgi:hypothetical protein
MKQTTFNPMKFGKEEDFKIAINELKWIKQRRENLTEDDFVEVAEKYNFPVDFLKHGMVGLVYPDDYRISTSKWYPIFYAWRVHSNILSNKLFRLHIDYISTKYWYLVSFAMALGGSELVAIFLWNYFDIGIVNLALLAVSFLLFFAALAFEMRNNLTEKKIALDEFRHSLKENGYEEIIENTNRTINEQYHAFASVGKIMQRKLEASIQMTIFKYHVENKTLVIEDWEDPIKEYRKRLTSDIEAY